MAGDLTGGARRQQRRRGHVQHLPQGHQVVSVNPAQAVNQPVHLRGQDGATEFAQPFGELS